MCRQSSAGNATRLAMPAWQHAPSQPTSSSRPPRPTAPTPRSPTAHLRLVSLQSQAGQRRLVLRRGICRRLLCLPRCLGPLLTQLLGLALCGALGSLQQQRESRAGAQGVRGRDSCRCSNSRENPAAATAPAITRGGNQHANLPPNQPPTQPPHLCLLAAQLRLACPDLRLCRLVCGRLELLLLLLLVQGGALAALQVLPGKSAVSAVSSKWMWGWKQGRHDKHRCSCICFHAPTHVFTRPPIYPPTHPPTERCAPPAQQTNSPG